MFREGATDSGFAALAIARPVRWGVLVSGVLSSEARPQKAELGVKFGYGGNPMMNESPLPLTLTFINVVMLKKVEGAPRGTCLSP